MSIEEIFKEFEAIEVKREEKKSEEKKEEKPKFEVTIEPRKEEIKVEPKVEVKVEEIKVPEKIIPIEEEQSIPAKEVYLIFGDKGEGKTTVAFSFPGEILCLSFDRKSSIVKYNMYGNDKRIHIFDVVKLMDYSTPERMLESAEQTYNAILELLTNYPKMYPQPDWVVIDAAQIFHQVCLPENEFVFNHYVPIEIASVKSQSNVLSASGSSKVISKIVRPYSGEVVKINVRGFEVRLTPEHPVLIVRGKVHKMSKEEVQKAMMWVPAKEVRVNDYVIIPRPKEGSSINEIDLNKYVSEYALTHGRKTIKLTLNKDLAKLLGYWLGDGSISWSGIDFYFGKDNKNKICVEEVTNLIKKIFNKQARIVNREVDIQIVFSQLPFAKFLRENFGSNSRDKYIPSWLIEVNEEIIKSFLQGYIMADGCVGKYGIIISTASKRAVYGVLMLLMRLGIMPFVTKVKPSSGHTKSGRKIMGNGGYSIWISRPDAVKLGYNYEISKTHRWYKVYDDFIVARVSKVSTEYYSGFVMNLETEDNTYAVPFIVHNCEWTMRKRHGIGPFEGIANLNVWKERRMYIRDVHYKALNLAKRGIIYTTHAETDEVIISSEIVHKKKVPAWIDVLIYETDYVLMVEFDEKDKNFVVKVVTSKNDKKLPTGKKYIVTGRRFWEVVGVQP
jgi:intein/homing endonuclease